MDFGNFGDGPRDQQPPTTSPPSGNNVTSGGGAAGGSEQPIFMHTMEHPAVTCDVCNGSIRGFRYKCMECVDYDLCTTCERRGNHPGHVMMRIAFPEQAGGAFRRFLGSGAAAERRPGGPGGIFGGGPGFPFDVRHHGHGLFHGGHHGHRERGCHRRGGPPGHASGRDSDGDSGQEDPKASANDCPYGLGRKGMKKWAKCMKKMAYQQRRSAEAYAKSASASACGAAATAAGLAGAPVQDGGAGEQQFDFTAAASQIQEFLNAFGIPIDVVELYDNFGNRGQPRAEDASTFSTSRPESGNPASQNATTTSAAADTSATNQQQNQQSGPIGFEGTTTSMPLPTNLAAHMQQLHLNGNNQQGVTTTAAEEVITPAVPSAPLDSSATPAAMIMDLDTDSSGWTLLDTERAPNNVGTTTNETTSTSMNFGLVGPPLAPLITPQPPSTPTPTSATTPPPSNANASGGRSLYPGLQQPQLQQLLSGVSQAMNSMVRNIPIVTNPSGPNPNSGPPSSTPSGNGPEMDVRCTTTLNQLLAMGFSNHDGWLSRLVVAKNGELEAVLNALFPVAGQ